LGIHLYEPAPQRISKARIRGERVAEKCKNPEFLPLLLRLGPIPEHVEKAFYLPTSISQERIGYPNGRFGVRYPVAVDFQELTGIPIFLNSVFSGPGVCQKTQIDCFVPT